MTLITVTMIDAKRSVMENLQTTRETDNLSMHVRDSAEENSLSLRDLDFLQSDALVICACVYG